LVCDILLWRRSKPPISITIPSSFEGLVANAENIIDFEKWFFEGNTGCLQASAGLRITEFTTPEYSKNGDIQFSITYLVPHEIAEEYGWLNNWEKTRWNRHTDSIPAGT
jgi:hypothetical protein